MENVITGTMLFCHSGSTPNLESTGVFDTNLQFQLIDIAWNSSLRSIYAATDINKPKEKLWNVEVRFFRREKKLLYVGQDVQPELNANEGFSEDISITPHIRFYIPPFASPQKVMDILLDKLIERGRQDYGLKYDDDDLDTLAEEFRKHIFAERDAAFVAEIVTNWLYLVTPAGETQQVFNDLSWIKFRSSKDITTCTICLEDFVGRVGVVNTICSHRFHRLCLRTWLGNKKTCPTCRTSNPLPLAP